MREGVRDLQVDLQREHLKERRRKSFPLKNVRPLSTERYSNIQNKDTVSKASRYRIKSGKRKLLGLPRVTDVSLVLSRNITKYLELSLKCTLEFKW